MWLLVFWFLGSAPVNDNGEPIGPSTSLGVVAVQYADEEKCKEAKANAVIRWTDSLPVKAVVTVCQKPAEG